MQRMNDWEKIHLKTKVIFSFQDGPTEAIKYEAVRCGRARTNGALI